ncbi:MAG: hypothetical protein H8E80_05020 [Desulfobacteraceae bacterium]|uniref:Uncharacterized protein n=1 Tax=Candidatus Desulfaltia bathyphila TaxID=2841697 RepID=A0A8J6TBT5_9BACT|nr:hypothetical protein [Candidatus Desulfaltia bathyphila]MBL7196432.1 hypothetical protein [Desulfobacterales bacterium]
MITDTTFFTNESGYALLDRFKRTLKHIRSRFPESALLKVNKSLVREGKKLRYPKNLRIKMFRIIIDAIKKHKTDIDIALCKEQPEIWKALGLDMKGLKCNCLS